MMRERILAVRGDSFDVGSVRREIEEIAGAFGDYLSQTASGGASKHRALGPVGKALQHARVVRGEALLGYARRVHEQVTGSSFPGGAVEKLDEGLRLLDALLCRADVPLRAQTEILSRIDYATYYDVRRRGMEFFSGWVAFAGERGRNLGTQETSGVPRFGGARKGEAGDSWKAIAEEYLSQARMAPAVSAADDEEESGS